MDKQKRLLQVYEYLRTKGLTRSQRELSETMQVSESTVSKALKGQDAYLTDKLLKRLNKSFGYLFNEDWLLYGVGDMLNSTPLQVNQSNIHGDNNVNTSLVDELAKAHDIASKAQEHVDKLLSIIDKLTQ